MNEPTYVPEMHLRAPEDRAEEIVWATLDTVYNLMREGATRLVIQELRETYAEMGASYPMTDEATLEMAIANAVAMGVEAPKSLLDLAPHSSHVTEALDLSFRVLAIECRKHLNAALDQAAEEEL